MAYLDEPLEELEEPDEPDEPEVPDEPDEPEPDVPDEPEPEVPDEPVPEADEPDCAGTELLGEAPVPGFSKQDFGIAEREAYLASSHFGSFFARWPLVSEGELGVEFTEEGELVERDVRGEP